MKIIVGLGNPGTKYLLTRHNLGFMLIDALISDSSVQNKHKSLVQKTKIAETPLLLVKPQTFMNLSGQAVREILSFYKSELEDLLVIHDDKDLAFGTMRFQKTRGAGGHNGVASIHQELGSSDYCRLKMGVAPNLKDDSSDIEDTSRFVLSPFNSSEQSQLPDFLKQGVKAVECFVKQGYEKSANQFNSK